MPPPPREPIGLKLNRIARALARAFDDALSEAGGSLAIWVVLASVKGQHHAMQRDLAERAGIEGATLTHHLARLELAGHIVRSRSLADRRIQTVELTESGERLFARLLPAVVAFDARLRSGLTGDEVDALEAVLERFELNVANTVIRTAP